MLLGRTLSITNGTSVSLDTSVTTLAITRPLRSTAPATIVLPSAPRPRLPRRLPPQYVSSTFTLPDKGLLDAVDKRQPGIGGIRRQPFALILRASSGGGPLLLHGISPVGNVATDATGAVEIVSLAREIAGAKVCEVAGPEFKTYTLTVEGDVIFDTELTQAEEAADLLRRVTIAADWMERRCLEGLDQSFAQFRKDLQREARRVAD